MILLSGHTLATAMKFTPESLSVNLEERKSTATMQIGPDAPDLAVGDWLRDETPGCGQGVIWRVKSVDMTYNTKTRLVTLEHIINTLRDAVLFGEHTPADITGDPDATTCTAEAAIEYILDRQDLWELASDFPYLSANNYKFNGDTLYAAIESVTATLEDPCWWYDLSTIPFKLHITQISDAVTCEMREGRNIQTLKKTIDRSRMYTRFYPIGKDNLQLGGGGYISKNESTYGIVAKVETNQKYETAEELEAWAWTRLERHCFPTVTITIGGEDLSRQTGESLDALTLGRKCRVPLPEFGTTIVERIIRINAGDKIKEPDKVTVTLGNELQDIASIMNEVIEEQESGHGGGGRGGMKKQGEDHAWFVDTDDHVGMIAEAIIGRGADGVDWSRVASIIVDGYGIHQRVVRAEGYLVTLEARIDLDEEALRAEFNNFAYSMRSELELSAASLRAEFTNEAASLRSEFTITAASLRSEFTNESASVRSLIGQEAGRIDLVVEGYGANAQVKSASIIAAVTDNNGKLDSSITVNADHVTIGSGSSASTVDVVIGGKLNVNDLSAGIANLNLVEVNRLSTTNDIAAGSLYGQNIYISGATPQAASFNINRFIKELRVVDAGNDTYKIQYKTHANANWQDATGTFSRATTLTGAWSGGTFEVTASPQGDTFDTTLQIISPTSGSGVSRSGKSVSRSFEVYHGSDEDHTASTGFTQTISIDASSVYNAVKLAASWNDNALTLNKDIDNASAASFPKTYYITCDTSLAWDSTDKKYKATPKAYCDGAARYTGTQQSTGVVSVTVDGYYAYLKEGSTVLQQVQDHHDIGYSQWQKSSDASVMVVQAKCQPDGSTTAPGGEGAEREYQLTYSNGYAHITRGGTNYASLACGGSSYSHSVTLTYRGWDSANSYYKWTTTTYVSGLTTGGRYTVHW